jgi:flagellar hook-length control protein FliK
VQTSLAAALFAPVADGEIANASERGARETGEAEGLFSLLLAAFPGAPATGVAAAGAPGLDRAQGAQAEATGASASGPAALLSGLAPGMTGGPGALERLGEILAGLAADGSVHPEPRAGSLAATALSSAASGQAPNGAAGGALASALQAFLATVETGLDGAGEAQGMSAPAGQAALAESGEAPPAGLRARVGAAPADGMLPSADRPTLGVNRLPHAIAQAAAANGAAVAMAATSQGEAAPEGPSSAKPVAGVFLQDLTAQPGAGQTPSGEQVVAAGAVMRGQRGGQVDLSADPSEVLAEAEIDTGTDAPSGESRAAVQRAARLGAAIGAGRPAEFSELAGSGALPSSLPASPTETEGMILDQDVALTTVEERPQAGGTAAMNGARPSAAPPGTLSMPNLAERIAARARGGDRAFEIQLDPPELGRIDVRLEIGDDNRLRAHLTVERADTFDLVQRDARALERALQAAGMKLEDGALQFSLRDQGFARGHRPDGASGFAGEAGGAEESAAEPARRRPQGRIDRLV